MMAGLTRFALLAAAAALCHGQAPPRIGLIDIYGLRKVPEAKIRQALGAREGDPLPPSKGDVEERLNALDGVVESHLEAVCCDEGRMILYVGIEERGVVHFELRESPEGEVTLPEEVAVAYRSLSEALQNAARRGVAGEDLTRGHSLVSDPETRAVQETLPALADQHFSALRNVLRESYDETQRAAAADILAYSTRKAEIVNELQWALRDPDAGVRGNAAHGLAALAVYQRLRPESGVKVSSTWFIEMLNSLSWADRNKAVWALQILTDQSDAAVLEQIRIRALPSLVEMARWKAPAHAIPAFMLLGRVAGFTSQQLEDAWSRGDRESVIAAATRRK
jgi:hypothetical protein